MTNVEPNNRNETNSDIFPWDILKADITLFFFFIKNYSSIPRTFKTKISQFYDYKKPK